ncbi:MAG TPA: GNAT family N-acetyltransferase [Acidimicrobiales bacterium]|nr:GNAT family N-acetyltransferase [Acidimicrobiales bacterium]
MTEAEGPAPVSRSVVVEEARSVTSELVEAFVRLVPQLSRSSSPPGQPELEEMVNANGTHLLMARLGEDGPLVGSLTLVLFRIPTGVRAWVEDVVVDESARGQGVGEALSRRALQLAGGEGARTVDLTSRPSREAANRLYRRLGFERRNTNVYRMELE